MPAAGRDFGEETGAGAALGRDAAATRLLFRAANERIEELNANFGSLLTLGEWICECADRACFERIAMTPAEFQTLRAQEGHFAVKRGHEAVAAGRVVEVCERYAVVASEGEGVSEPEPSRGARGRTRHRSAGSTSRAAVRSPA